MASDVIRSYGFTILQANLLERAGVRGEDLHLVFSYKGKDVPLVLALKEGWEDALSVFRESQASVRTLREVGLLGAYAEAESILEEARKKSRIWDVDINKGDQLARHHDINCSPLQRYRSGSFHVRVDFDEGEIEVSGPVHHILSVDEYVTTVPDSDYLSNALIDIGVEDEDAEVLADMVFNGHGRWDRAVGSLDEEGYTKEEVREILIFRAHETRNYNQLSIPGIF
jgi:hypothetical protein